MLGRYRRLRMPGLLDKTEAIRAMFSGEPDKTLRARIADLAQRGRPRLRPESQPLPDEALHGRVEVGAVRLADQQPSVPVALRFLGDQAPEPFGRRSVGPRENGAGRAVAGALPVPTTPH